MNMKKVFGFMVVKGFDLRKCIFCRSYDDVVANNLLKGYPIYECEGIQISDEVYIWNNPLTDEKQYVKYHNSIVKDKYLQKKIK